MKIGFVRNKYLYTEKFSAHTQLFKQAFEKQGAEFLVFANDSFDVVLKNTIQKIADLDGVLFWDKDIALAKYIEQCGIRVFNSSNCIDCCDSKIMTHIALAARGIQMPQTMFMPFSYSNIGYSDFEFLNRVKLLGFPIVVKSDRGSFGEQVVLAKNEEELLTIVKSAKCRLIFQSFESGIDVRVNVVGGKVVNSVYRTNDGDFRKNSAIGGEMSSYEADKAISDIAVRASTAVGADFCGVDILRCSGGDVVLEVNSNAHFINALNATGIDMSDSIAAYVVGELSK